MSAPVTDRLAAVAQKLRAEGRDDDAMVLSEALGALRFQARMIEEVRRDLGTKGLQQLQARASR